MSEIILACPNCEHGDELALLENVRVHRELGEVTTNHTEYLDLINPEDDEYREVGIECGRCKFAHVGDDWKAVLIPIERGSQ